jgi:predicted permease
MLHVTDFRYALRLLKKSLSFTALTALVLAGGLGISIYTFAVLNTMLYKPLPIPDGDEVMRISGEREGRLTAIGAYELNEIRSAGSRSFVQIGAYQTEAAILSSDDGMARALDGIRSEWNLFEFVGVSPLLGRGFVRDDGIDGAEPVVVIGYTVWQTLFNGAPDVVDQVVRINNQPTRIVGVMPEGFAFPTSATVWLPLSEKTLRPTGYSDDSLDAYARLRNGATGKSAEAELSALLARVQQANPRAKAKEETLEAIRVLTFQEMQTYPDGPIVFGVLNTVSIFILLLACVNVGNMLLARTNERLREIAIRVALGAPRWRLMFQMMLESMLICAIGGACAIGIAAWALHATNGFMMSQLEGHLPYWWNWSLDVSSVAAGLFFVLLAIALVSALPTYSATSINSSAILRDGTRGARGRTSGRISRALVTLQIVLISVIMVVGSSMAIIAYRAAHIDFGIDTTRLLTMSIALPQASYPTSEKQSQFYDRLLSQLRSDQSVEAAMISSNLGETRFAVDEREYHTIDDYPIATAIILSDSPQPLGSRILDGRMFDSRDIADGLQTAIISDTMARAYWPGESALGRRLRLIDEEGRALEQRTIVGVMSDVRRGENLLVTDSKTYASIYLPLKQSAGPTAAVLVRYRNNEADARNAMYNAISRVDGYVVPSAVSNYSEILQKITVMAIAMTEIFVKSGFFALLLAMTGIYGLSSNAVVQRTHEIGLRRAIGASDFEIVRMFIASGMRQLAAGLVVSTFISVAIMIMVSRFAGVGFVTLIGIAAFVAVTVSALVLVAIYVSTKKAVEYEPAVALRYE